MSSIACTVYHNYDVLPRRRLMEERFNVVTVLGSGSFGEVLLVEDRYFNGALLVIKRARISPTVLGVDYQMHACELQRVTMSEARIMSFFNDEGIVRLIDAWHEEIDGTFCLLMEYCAGGDLERFVLDSYPLAEATLRLIFLQCLLALAQMHAKSVIHRDMKLSNILVSGCGSDNAVPMLKIADFGLSIVSSETASLAAPPVFVGTPLYMSPETAAGAPCGFGSDVWSLGVVFYRLMTCSTPFVGNTFAELRYHITTANPPHPSRLASTAQYSLPLGDLVLSMLAKHPFARPTARELLASPVFAAALRGGAWRPRALRGAVSLFACQPGRRLRIRAQPRRGAAVVAELRVGDHVLVADEVLGPAPRAASGGELRAAAPQATGAWLRVLAPRAGFCATHVDGCPVLQYVGDARRPALLSPAGEEERRRGGGGGERRTRSVSTVGAASVQAPSVRAESRPRERAKSQSRESHASKLFRVMFG